METLQERLQQFGTALAVKHAEINNFYSYMSGFIVQHYPTVEIYEQHRDSIEESIFIGYMTKDEKQTMELSNKQSHNQKFILHL